MRYILSLTAVLVAVSPALRAETYEIDSSHSHISFRVKHLVGRVPGRFTKFAGTVSYEPGKPGSWKVDAAIDPASINTDHEKRDTHLRNADFFNVEKCKDMSFKSTKVTDIKGDTAKLHGDLTMHCVTKPVILDLELGGVTKTAWGTVAAGFSAHGKINRKDWGITFNKTLDSGGLMLGEEVEVTIDIEAGLKDDKKDGKKAKK